MIKINKIKSTYKKLKSRPGKRQLYHRPAQYSYLSFRWPHHSWFLSAPWPSWWRWFLGQWHKYCISNHGWPCGLLLCQASTFQYHSAMSGKMLWFSRGSNFHSVARWCVSRSLIISLSKIILILANYVSYFSSWIERGLLSSKLLFIHSLAGRLRRRQRGSCRPHVLTK